MRTTKATFFTQQLLTWAQTNLRSFPWRDQLTPYTVLISEKLLQQTSSSHVLKVYPQFIRRYPTIQKLARARVPSLRRLIQSLGFHNQRSHQLKAFAQHIMTQFHGEIPHAREDLLVLPGVGRYISNAILCFAFDQPVPIIDTNVQRITQRYFDWDRVSIAKQEARIRPLLPVDQVKTFNWGLIDFANLICRRIPQCGICPLSSQCSSPPVTA